MDQTKFTEIPASDRPHPLASLFVSNRHLLWLTVLLIVVGGLSALLNLPRLEDPIISNRNAQIITFLPGASADRVEALISNPLEIKLKEISSIKHIESTSRAGVSVVSVELADAVNETTNDAIFSEIRDKISEAAVRFPAEASAPSFDDKRNAVAYTLISAIYWRDNPDRDPAILRRHAEELADRLRAVPGTELVRIYGAPKEEIRVEPDPDRMAALGLTPHDLQKILTDADAKRPSGAVRNEMSDLLVEVSGEFDSVERIRQVPLQVAFDGQTLTLGDVASVRRTQADPPQSIGIHNGSRSIFIAARVRSDQRVDQWNAQATESLEQFKKRIGGHIQSDVVFNQNTYTSSRLSELVNNLLLGALVVFIVVLLVMGLRASIIISTALPLVASMTLFVVAMQGGKLHQMSIFGMIIALGLLIDNAIVVTDDIRRYRKSGFSPVQAVSRTIHHLFLPLLSSTLTTILSFLPILLLPGPAGDFVSSIASSVIIALSASFFVAMTLIASLAGVYGHSEGKSFFPLWIRDGMFSSGDHQIISGMFLWIFRRPWWAVGLSLILPLTGFFLASTLGSQFFPRTDRNMYEVEVRLPTDASLERTRDVARRIDEIIRGADGVREVDWMIGESFPTVYYNLIMNQDGSQNYAHGIITSESFDDVSRLIRELQLVVDNSFPEAQVLFSKFAQGPPADADIELRISGPDIETLQTLGEEVRLHLARHPDVLHTLTTLPRAEPKIQLDAREVDLRLSGLGLTDMADQIQGALDGWHAGTVLEDIEELPVRIRYETPGRRDMSALENLLIIPNSSNMEAGNHWIPVSALVGMHLVPAKAGITRRDGMRVNKIYGFVKPGGLPVDIANQILARLEQSGFQVPRGYSFQLGGETENRDEAVGNLLLYLPVIVVLTIATLVLTFRSIKIAFILLLAAPMSVGFGLMATWALQFPISFNTIIGSLGLMGLAFNSSIVVLASILGNPLAASGNPEALVEAVLSSMRHLISTTMTTIGSFLPLLLFIGGEFWPPLAIVLAGGVGGSTLLAVTLTPALFRILNAQPDLTHD
ncbi:MAG: efflux RND transporter permease subunit [Verrucomicrobia bacterium]|nr:efflux RND transporter permease subunit [Verrucomicrobiota bacterium]